MQQKIELIQGDDGTVMVFINRDHWDNAASQAAAWEMIARHLADVQGVTIQSFLK